MFQQFRKHITQRTTVAISRSSSLPLSPSVPVPGIEVGAQEETQLCTYLVGKQNQYQREQCIYLRASHPSSPEDDLSWADKGARFTINYCEAMNLGLFFCCSAADNAWNSWEEDFDFGQGLFSSGRLMGSGLFVCNTNTATLCSGG